MKNIDFLKKMREKTAKQLEGELAKKRGKLALTRVDMAMSKEKNLKNAKNIRREIAQILTILNNKKKEK